MTLATVPENFPERGDARAGVARSTDPLEQVAGYDGLCAHLAELAKWWWERYGEQEPQDGTAAGSAVVTEKRKHHTPPAATGDPEQRADIDLAADV